MAIGGPNLELWRRSQRLRNHWPDQHGEQAPGQAQDVDRQRR